MSVDYLLHDDLRIFCIFVGLLNYKNSKQAFSAPENQELPTLLCGLMQIRG